MKHKITPERLLGEYIGELNGICAWDIPEQLREKLERRAKELEELQIEMEVHHKYKGPKLKSTFKFSYSSHIFDIVITSDFNDEITFNHVIKEKLFSKEMSMYVLDYKPSGKLDLGTGDEPIPFFKDYFPEHMKEPLFDAPKMQTFSVPFDKTQPIVFTGNQDIYDITTMD